MRILSYRGPGESGGVSSTLSLINSYQPGEWWHVQKNELCCNTNDITFSLAEDVCQKHYRYCNNFLWPVLHDLPEYARYCEDEHRGYRSFNANIAYRVQEPMAVPGALFVNDYQFALVPRHLRRKPPTSLFWHIPWPKKVDSSCSPQIAELCRALLHSSFLCFHTEEYLENFFRFVASDLPDADLDFERSVISFRRGRYERRHETRLGIAPLGLDVDRWHNLALTGGVTGEALQLGALPYVLSVDRIDYTKGVLERLNAINAFFERYPDWLARVSFVQIASRSRQGLECFDEYWRKCNERVAEINRRFGNSSWSPVVWVTSQKTPEELATLYRNATVMLVSPVRDGLNLTAKEFIASQSGRAGLLALTRGAGVWTELSEHCFTVDDKDERSFAHSIDLSLRMTYAEKRERMRHLYDIVARNTLRDWWVNFQSASRWFGKLREDEYAVEDDRLCKLGQAM